MLINDNEMLINDIVSFEQPGPGCHSVCCSQDLTLFMIFIFQGRKSNAKIHEDAEGGIYVVGVTTRLVHSLQEVSYHTVTLLHSERPKL